MWFRPPVMKMTLPDRSGMSWSGLNFEVPMLKCNEIQHIEISMMKTRECNCSVMNEESKTSRNDERAYTYTLSHGD